MDVQYPPSTDPAPPPHPWNSPSIPFLAFSMSASLARLNSVDSSCASWCSTLATAPFTASTVSSALSR